MLQFDCRAGEKLKVDGVSLVSNDAEVPYNGPLFEELEEDVQLGFLDYLNERHVNDDLAVYIAEYAELKEGNEYVSFLEKTKDFVKD